MGGAFVVIGENDAYGDDSSSQVTKVFNETTNTLNKSWFTYIRELFNLTDWTDEDIPIVLTKIHTDTTSISVDTITEVRAAMDTITTSEVSLLDLSSYELQSNKRDLNTSSILKLGEDLVSKLKDLTG